MTALSVVSHLRVAAAGNGHLTVLPLIATGREFGL